ncbi:MAG: hypothetical protein EOP48_16950 [Sphingobacteriales bacterium]|nr:MAG: hypothetical protein EOP48_16950 [Sphingobacteriales bacterium]
MANKVKYINSAANLAKDLKDTLQQANWLGMAYKIDPDPSQKALFDWGYANYRAKNYDAADSIFCNVYQTKFPDQVYGYMWCARTAVARDTTLQQGIHVPPYQKLLSYTDTLPDSARVKFNSLMVEANTYLAQYYANVAKQTDSAIVHLEKIVAIDPTRTEIAKTNVLMGDAVGIAGERIKQWDRYEVLRSKATYRELLDLTNDTNAVVRCYAFQALAARRNTDLFSIVVQHLSDTATVHTLYGCLGSSQKAGDIFLETLKENRGNGTFKQLNEKQKVTIDSLLLFDDNNRLQARDELLAKIQPLEKYYERLKQIAIEEKNKVAVVTLAKYRKKQALNLFKVRLSLFINRLTRFK